MTNQYFNNPGNLVPFTKARAEDVSAAYDLLAAGFALLPVPLALQAGNANYAVDAGTANAYKVTLGSLITGYVDGLEVKFQAGAANTGAATMNVNNLGAVAIKRPDGAPLQANDILAGQMVMLIYSASQTVFQLVVTALAAANSAYASATAAAGSASAASSSAGAASGSATAAAGSATAAAGSATSAAASATAAAASAGGYGSTSTTSLTVATGAQSFTTQASKAWTVGQTVSIAYSGSVVMTGTITAYNASTGAMTVNVTATQGTGTYAAWAIGLGTPSIAGVSTTFNVKQTFAGSTTDEAVSLKNAAEQVNIVAAAPAAAQTVYLSSGAVNLFTVNAANNWTPNIAHSAGTSLNTAMAVGESVTVVLEVTQGATAYFSNALQIDGSAVTVKWLGGQGAPTAGNASGIDAYSYVITKTASATYTVLGSVAQYK